MRQGWKEFLDRWATQAREGFLGRWEYRVIWVLLVLPVLLVILAAMDPSVRAVLREWLLSWLRRLSPQPG